MARTADDLLTVFRLGKESQRNFNMQISKKLPPGQGGSPGQAPPKPHPGPFVPAPKQANLVPQDFIPFSPATRDSEGFAIPYLRTPELRDMEMDHFKRFIKNSGESTWDLTKKNSPMQIAMGKKKKKGALKISDVGFSMKNAINNQIETDPKLQLYKKKFPPKA